MLRVQPVPNAQSGGPWYAISPSPFPAMGIDDGYRMEALLVTIRLTAKEDIWQNLARIPCPFGSRDSFLDGWHQPRSLLVCSLEAAKDLEHSPFVLRIGEKNYHRFAPEQPVLLCDPAAPATFPLGLWVHAPQSFGVHRRCGHGMATLRCLYFREIC